MNIIKLKDIVKPGDDMFNKHLKGKYAYWVHMRYIVSFDLMAHEGYVACENDINKLLKKEDGTYPKPFGAPYIDMYEEDVFRYIDIYATDKANNVMDYRRINKYVSDHNITLDEVKKFRTWLSTELLKFDQNNQGAQINDIYNEETTHILNYYAKGMYDDIIKALVVFGGVDVKQNNVVKNSCGCDSNLSSLYETSISSCDPLYIYKKNIYMKMVEIFSNVEFWQQFPKEFIKEFKLYIDNIVQCNLKLVKSDYISKFEDCICSSKSSTEQELNINILKRLSESLDYIYYNDIIGHKNYIHDALNDWSSNLYELMEW